MDIKNMSKEEFEEKVRNLIAENLTQDPEEVKPDAKFTEDLGADSLDTVELMMAMEENFDIEIPDEDAEKLKCVKDATDYLWEKLSNK